VEDLTVLYDFFNEGEAEEAEVDQQYETALTLIANLELRNMLGNEEDALGALLKINPGAGGTESQDWAEMLMRMYIRYGERNNYKVMSPGFMVISMVSSTTGETNTDANEVCRRLAES